MTGSLTDPRANLDFSAAYLNARGGMTPQGLAAYSGGDYTAGVQNNILGAGGGSGNTVAQIQGGSNDNIFSGSRYGDLGPSDPGSNVWRGGSINPVLGDQYYAETPRAGITFPGNNDPNAWGTGSIGSSSTGGAVGNPAYGLPSFAQNDPLDTGMYPSGNGSQVGGFTPGQPILPGSSLTSWQQSEALATGGLTNAPGTIGGADTNAFSSSYGAPAFTSPSTPSFDPSYGVDTQWASGNPTTALAGAGAAAGAQIQAPTEQGYDTAPSQPVDKRSVTAASQTIAKGIESASQAAQKTALSQSASWQDLAKDYAFRIFVIVLGFIFVVAALRLFGGNAAIRGVGRVATA